MHRTWSNADLVALMPALTRRARSLMRDPARADDMVQDTMLALWQRLQAGVRIDDLEAYAMTTLRHARRRPAPEVPVEEQDLPPAPDPTQSRLDLADTLRAIARLPDTQRQLLRDRATGLSYDDLARRHALPRGTVMSRLARAREQLRAALGE